MLLFFSWFLILGVILICILIIGLIVVCVVGLACLDLVFGIEVDCWCVIVMFFWSSLVVWGFVCGWLRYVCYILIVDFGLLF